MIQNKTNPYKDIEDFNTHMDEIMELQNGTKSRMLELSEIARKMAEAKPFYISEETQFAFQHAVTETSKRARELGISIQDAMSAVKIFSK